MSESDRDELVYAYVEGVLEAEELIRFEEAMADDHELRNQVHAARAFLDDLASMSEDRQPSHDLWPGIQGRIVQANDVSVRILPSRPGWKVTLGVPQLIAAGIAMILLSGGGTWLAMRTGPGIDAPTTVAQAPEAGSFEFVSADAFRDYDRSVAELQAILEAGKDRLSPETMEVLEQSLASIDSAIRDARRALAADPESGALNQLLGRHLRTKLDLLRRTAAAVQSNA